ncbi:hypothetical protein KVR01_000556 [Diaporthe batatas]|uniref:uncharacterized protein n=1 Tax=Diaporthe batatas TaxID=748121 RepID=UPI001D04346D|nr:uncharacterized protein KVR01_000556 [Diaporthe batatas]KAG8169811.1 hypothetical protein KVR01_000556 [Diaporthe batatas]
MAVDTNSPGMPLMAGSSDNKAGRDATGIHERPSMTSTEGGWARAHGYKHGSMTTGVPQLQLGGWWWWELIAMLLSLVSAALLIPVLVKVDGLAVEDWPYAILPNTLLSILTNVTKTAMMVPIAACLSQMKWDHFYHRANPLDHLQLYDEASRGPYGSFMLIITGRAKVLSAWAFAVVTLVALGIDPSTQQTIETRTRHAEMSNVTALVGLAQNYSSRAFVSSSFQGFNGAGHEPNLHTLGLQTSILNGAAGSPPAVDFYCPEPATECAWGDFDTLAVCGTFKNLTGNTEAYNKTCVTTKSSGPGNNIDCTYEFPDSLPINMSLYAGGNGDTSLFNSTSNVKGTSTVFMVNTTDSINFTAEVYSMSWSWCKKTFHNLTASPAGLHHAEITTRDLVPFADNPLYAGLLPSYAYYKEPGSSKPEFNLSVSVDTGLFSYITKLFTRELRAATRSRDVEDSLSLAEYMYLTDLANLTTNIADTLTAQLRSVKMDNTMAGTAEGRAWYRVTYYHVRWPWIIVVFAEVVATAVLLGSSIFLTRRQPLLKASSMALLAFGLHGWSDEEIQGTGTPRDLDEVSKRMRARLGHDEEGYLKLLKVDDTTK